MSSQAKPVFGKRSTPRAPAPSAAPVIPRDDHAAFFAALRETTTETDTIVRVSVPRSFKAAFLAGLVVGCALVGFNVKDGASAGSLSAVAGFGVDPHAMLPALLVIGLVGGARAAAVIVLVVHSLLVKAEQTSPLAYAVGGALASGAVAGAFLLAAHQPPSHGWPVEIAAGAAGGFLYRLFAGAEPGR